MCLRALICLVSGVLLVVAVDVSGGVGGSWFDLVLVICCLLVVFGVWA